MYDQLKGILPQSFKDYFNHKSTQHQYNTRGNRIIAPHVKTTTYGSNSITLQAIKHWNEIQNELDLDPNLPDMTRPKFLKAIQTYINNQ